MPKNIFGVDMIYPTSKTKPNVWYIKDDPTKDAQTEGSDWANIDPVGPGEFQLTDNSKVRMNVTPKPNYQGEAIGGCGMSFSDCAARGYAVTPDDWTNVEMVGYYNFSSFSPSDNEIIQKGPTMRHTSTQCCQGHTEGCRTGGENPTNSEFFKEMWHVNYHSKGYKSLPNIGNLKTGNWFGVAFVTYLTESGGATARKLEHYIDPDGDGTGWIKVNELLDTGGWGTGGDDCDGDPDQITTWGSGRMQYRWDATGGTDLTFKWFAVREIDPSGAFGEDPGNPDPDTGGGGGGTEVPTTVTEISFQLKLQRDINIYRTNPCEGDTGEGGGGGGGSGTNIIYNLASGSDKELSDSSTYDHRTRLAQKVTSSGSSLFNKVVLELTVPLKKSGTPGASPLVYAKIWNSSNTVVYTSSTTFDPSTFTTSYVDKTFDFSDNTRALVVGDRIGVEYTGTSSSNYVVGSYKSDTVSKSQLSQYEGSSWDDKSSRDLSAKMVA